MTQYNSDPEKREPLDKGGGESGRQISICRKALALSGSTALLALIYVDSILERVIEIFKMIGIG